MSTVIATLQAKAGRAGDVEEALRDLAQRTLEEPGAVAYAVHRNDDTFIVYEKYADAAAREQHFAAPYVTGLLARFTDLLTGEPQVEFVDEIAGFSR